MPEVSHGPVELWYREAGRGQPLVLLHGLGSSHVEWTAQIEHFAGCYRTIAPDLRGHGRSGAPRGPYRVADFRDDVAALIETLGLGPVHLAGFSLGGAVAFDLAVHRPGLLRSLTLVNSGPAFLLRGWAARRWLWSRLALVRLRGMRAMGERIAAENLPGESRAALREQVIERWAANDPRAYCASLHALPGWSVADRLAEIVAPCLVVTADADYTPVAYKRHYAGQLRDARVVVVPKTRHLLPFEAPEALTAAMAGFLEEVARRRG